MKEIKLKARAKINLTLDVIKRRDDGYHDLKMIMYSLSLYDGVLIKNSGRYGSINWDNNRELLTENVALIKELQNSGAQIIVTTSRTEEFREKLINILNKNNIFPYAVIMGLNHSTRVVINDFASTNPYPSGIAINIPRNGNLNEFINNWRYL